MRPTLLLASILVLTGCGQGFSSSRAKSLAMEYWREHGISMDDLGLCRGRETRETLQAREACIAAAECISPAVGDMWTNSEYARRHRIENIYLAFPAFQPTDVRVLEATNATSDGIDVGENAYESADISVRVSPSDRVATYTDCAAFAQLLSSLQQPVTFNAQYIGEQRTSGGMVRVEWRLEHLYRNSNR